MKVKLAPSLLSGDFSYLAEEAKRMMSSGADILHMDIMDGHFVPNLTIGPPVIASLRKHTNAFLGTILASLRLPFDGDGPSQETKPEQEWPSILKGLREKFPSVQYGLALKPKTPVESVFSSIPYLDMVLVMTVEPGFGGQSMIMECLDKAKVLRSRYPDLDIQVDGGVTEENIDKVALSGANVVVAGTAVFKDPRGPSEIIRILRSKMTQHE